MSMTRRKRLLLDARLGTDVFYDEFLTHQAIPRKCEPGQGSLYLVDNASKMLVSGGRLNVSGGTASWLDTGTYSNAIARKGGRLFVSKFQFAGTGFVSPLALRSSSGVRSAQVDGVVHQFFLNSSAFYYGSGDSLSVVGPALSQNIEYQLGILLLPNNTSQYFIKGGSYAFWTRLLVNSYTNSTAQLYLGTGNLVNAWSCDYLRVVDLPDPYNTNTGAATSALTNPAIGSTATHTADAVLVVTFTANFDVKFRKQDDNNYWRLYDAGTALCLSEVNGGTETVRASYAHGAIGASHAWLVVEGNFYRGFINTGAVFTYTDPGNFLTTRTMLQTASVVTAVSSWPRTITDWPI